jgi:signal peptide peptidase SppA
MGSQIVQLVRALSQPVLLEHDTLVKLAQIFQRKISGESFDGPTLHAEFNAATPAQRASTAPSAGPTIAVIPIHGMIAQHPQSMGTSTDEIGAQLAAALNNPRVDAILLDIDSPGGTVDGIPELGAKIAAARGVKPITAFANSFIASAAYWLASQADEVVVTPSGQVGSIGVYMLHEDWSQKLANEGVKIRAISAGKYKLEGAKWEPLDPDAEAFIQQRVDEVYGWFVKAVASGRRDTQTNVRNGYGEGRMLGAAQAVKANLADRVGTFNEAVGGLARRAQRPGPRADLLRRHLELDSRKDFS